MDFVGFPGFLAGSPWVSVGFPIFLAGSQLPRVYVGLWQQPAFRGALSKMTDAVSICFRMSLESFFWFRAGSQSFFWVPGVSCVSVSWLAEKALTHPSKGQTRRQPKQISQIRKQRSRNAKKPTIPARYAGNPPATHGNLPKS